MNDLVATRKHQKNPENVNSEHILALSMIYLAQNFLGMLAHGSRGFRFGYVQRACKETECFQCNLINQDTRTGDWVNYEISCQGPHFHQYSELACVSDSKLLMCDIFLKVMINIRGNVKCLLFPID